MGYNRLDHNMNSLWREMAILFLDYFFVIVEEFIDV